MPSGRVTALVDVLAPTERNRNRQGDDTAFFAARLCRCQHPDIASTINDVDHDMATGSADGDVGRPIADLQASQRHLIEERRQLRLVEADMLRVRVKIKA